MATGIYTRTAEHGRRISEGLLRNPPRLGDHLTEEQKQHLREVNLGKHHSPETLQKMSLSHRGKPTWCKGLKGEKAPRWGSHPSEETRVKMRLARLGKHLSDETKKKVGHSGTSNPMYGKHPSAESIEKNRQAHLGKKASEETKAKLRTARIRQKPHFRDTYIEKKLQGILQVGGIAFETNKLMLGHPDIFIEPNICIFADGDYFHANPKRFYGDELIKGHTAQYIWNRDNHITQELLEQGYIVLRFWEYEINKDLPGCFDKICSVLQRSN